MNFAFLYEFRENWKRKLDNIDGDNLSQVFDRFITLYIIYNSLYNNIYSLQHTKTKSEWREKTKATKKAVKYLGGKNIIEKIKEDRLSEHLKVIVEHLEDETYGFDLHNGEISRDKDEIILKQIKSNNTHEKALGILMAIYAVRCNIFHGHKDFAGNQKKLIESLNKILECVSDLLFEKLSTDTRGF